MGRRLVCGFRGISWNFVEFRFKGDWENFEKKSRKILRYGYKYNCGFKKEYLHINFKFYTTSSILYQYIPPKNIRFKIQCTQHEAQPKILLKEWVTEK